MTSYAANISKLETILADYRNHDGIKIDGPHITNWISQFPKADQTVLLEELAFTLEKTYISRSRAEKFLSDLLTNTALAGNDPGAFWKKANILNIQKGGSSQSDLLEIFESKLKAEFGFGFSKSASADVHLYIDDGIYSGNRVHTDFKPWLEEREGQSGDIHVFVLAQHAHGKDYAAEKIAEYQKKFGTDFIFRWWHCVKLEDRRAYRDKSDVLRPTELPNSPEVVNYANYLSAEKYPVQLRNALEAPHNYPCFSSEGGRQAIERILLEAGARILPTCPNFPQIIRPYGYDKMKTLGFGALIATYRNCPNTTPVALWAGDPWHPLLPRKTN
jgi:hypothetical protein